MVTPEQSTASDPPAPGEAVAPDEAVAPPTPLTAGTERFDELVQVVRPMMRVAVLISALTIIGVALWAIFATVTTTKSGTGSVLPESGFSTVIAPSPGLLGSLAVKEGDTVTAGQDLATITDLAGTAIPVVAPVGGTVELLLILNGSSVTLGETLLLITPDGATRGVLLAPIPADAEQISPGMSVVATISGCEPLESTVSWVSSAPLTQSELAERIGLPGVVPVITPGDVGMAVFVPAPDNWCPSADYGRSGDVVITTGSLHPIDYLKPS